MEGYCAYKTAGMKCPCDAPPWVSPRARILSTAFALIARAPNLHGLVAALTGCDDVPIPYRVA